MRDLIFLLYIIRLWMCVIFVFGSYQLQALFKIFLKLNNFVFFLSFNINVLVDVRQKVIKLKWIEKRNIWEAINVTYTHTWLSLHQLIRFNQGGKRKLSNWFIIQMSWLRTKKIITTINYVNWHVICQCWSNIRMWHIWKLTKDITENLWIIELICVYE